MNLIAGQNISLPIINLKIYMTVKNNQHNIKVAPGLFLLQSNHKVNIKKDYVCHKNPIRDDIGIKLDKDFFILKLDKVSDDISKIVFTLTITDDIYRKHAFKHIEEINMLIYADNSNTPIALFDLKTQSMNETSLIMGEVYLRNGAWKFRALGNGFVGGFQPMLEYFGIKISSTEDFNFESQQSALDFNTEHKVINIAEQQPDKKQDIAVKIISEGDYTILNQEIRRLCSLQKDLFNDLLKLPHVFQDDDKKNIEESKGKSYFTEGIKHIENELQKLEKMEVVIAIVGTMKAGKSTTINAIVGSEVLPNRNAPMTTLPTLIRNKHGQEEPILKLDKREPLENLSIEIAKKLAILSQNNELSKLTLHNSKDGAELIEELLRNKCYQFNSEYHGQAEIFSFLKHLNDLMRLAKDELIEIAPPYEAYENINDLPVIEIEFYHLKGKAESAQGSLAILDTPGPNEFGQSAALRKVFKTQLEKASAVGLVIDYTQMRSESEAKVRQEVTEVTKQLSKENIYILVNKFDQKNTNSMQKQEVQDYVVKTLMTNNINPSQVFPISSQHAYLANCAKHQLAIKGKLPDPEKESWVKDFGIQAMGQIWLTNINNYEVVQACANNLWDASYFNEPLDGIIREAHSTAAEKSIKSALNKVINWNKELKNTCSIINTSLNADIENITAAVKSLEANLAEFSEVKKNINTTTESSLNDLGVFLNKLADNNKINIENEIKSFFDKSGKIINEKASEQANQKAEDEMLNFRDFAALILSRGTVNRYKDRVNKIKKRSGNFDANNPILSFSSQSEAEYQLSTIQDSIKGIFEALGEDFNTETDTLILKMSKEISEKINQSAHDILNKAQQQLGDNGFTLNFSLPDINLDVDSFDTNAILSGGMQQKTEYETRSRRQEGAWGTFCSWFGTDDWGWENYEEKIDKYEVDTRKIRDNILMQLSQYESNYTQQFKSYLKQQFEPTIERHIKEISDYLQKYQALLNEGKKSNQLAQFEKQELGSLISILIKKNTIQANDIEVIKF